MSKRYLKNLRLLVNDVDYGTYVTSLSMDVTRENPECTVMTSLTHEYVVGLTSSTLEVEFIPDPDVLEPVLWLWYDQETVLNVALIPEAGDVDASNPVYAATMQLRSYAPIQNGPGEPVKIKASFTPCPNLLGGSPV